MGSNRPVKIMCSTVVKVQISQRKSFGWKKIGYTHNNNSLVNVPSYCLNCCPTHAPTYYYHQKSFEAEKVANFPVPTPILHFFSANNNLFPERKCFVF